MEAEPIQQKSGILPWTEENIKNTPEVIGIYVLRSSPTNGDIILVEKSTNLKTALLDHYRESTLLGIQFFDWYAVGTEDEAESIRELWSLKYNLH